MVTGFSLGAESVLLSQLAIYFDRYFNMCTAISQAGLSIGILVMPLLTQLLLDNYGWRGTLMLFAGLNLHLIVCGALVKPFPQKGTSQKTTKTESELTKVLEKEPKIRHHRGFGNLIYYLDLDLFTNFKFISMLVYNLGSGYCFTGWLIYRVPHAIELGFQSYKASLLATFGGVGNLVACFLYPVLKLVLSDKTTLYLTSISSSLALAVDPLVSMSHSYTGLAILSASFAFARGMAIMSVYKVIKNIVAEEKMANAILWINVTYSIGAICSGFFSGKFHKARNAKYYSKIYIQKLLVDDN